MTVHLLPLHLVLLNPPPLADLPVCQADAQHLGSLLHLAQLLPATPDHLALCEEEQEGGEGGRGGRNTDIERVGGQGVKDGPEAWGVEAEEEDLGLEGLREASGRPPGGRLPLLGEQGEGGALLAAVLHEGVQPVLVLLTAALQSVHGHCVWLTG